MKKKLIYFFCLIIFLSIALFLSNFFRATIYSDESSSMLVVWLADIGGNIVVVPILNTLLWLIKRSPTNNKLKDILLVLGFYEFSEGLSFYFPDIGTFDPKDMLGYLIGSVIIFTIVFLVEGMSILELDDFSKK